MTEQQQNHMEDLIVRAIQAGKKENSGLVGDIKHSLEGWITDTIKTVVNGKIDNLTKMQTEQMHILTKIQQDITSIQIETNKIDGDTKPIVNEYNNKKTAITWIGNRVSYLKNFGVACAAIITSITTIWVFIKVIKHFFE